MINTQTFSSSSMSQAPLLSLTDAVCCCFSGCANRKAESIFDLRLNVGGMRRKSLSVLVLSGLGKMFRMVIGQAAIFGYSSTVFARLSASLEEF